MQPFWNYCVQLGIKKTNERIGETIVFFFIYLKTKDGMDGKQARRTKSSSALGELFDHGVDSWASFLFPVCLFSIFTKTNDGISPLAMHILLLTIYLTFICTHWEKYNTKVLFLPWAYDISMLVRNVMLHIFQKLIFVIVLNRSIFISICFHTELFSIYCTNS